MALELSEFAAHMQPLLLSMACERVCMPPCVVASGCLDDALPGRQATQRLLVKKSETDRARLGPLLQAHPAESRVREQVGCLRPRGKPLRRLHHVNLPLTATVKALTTRTWQDGNEISLRNIGQFSQNGLPVRRGT